MATEKQFTKKDRVSSKAVQSNDKKICMVRWLDKKPILMASTCTGIDPEGMVKR